MLQNYVVSSCRFIGIIFALLHLTYPLSVGGKNAQITYYISSSEGSDTNHGHSIDRPLKSISSIRAKSNIKIFLKSGDVFFESISGLNNCTLDRYGKGERPVICGFKVLKNTNAWEYDNNTSCWRLDLAEQSNFVGAQTPKGLEKIINNVGFIYIPKSDRLLGNNLRNINSLVEEGDFHTSELIKIDDIKATPFRYVWMNWHENPAILGHICFPTFQHGIYNLTDCIIRNISVVGFSRHGICSLSNSIIDNCQIDLIGGSVQLGYSRWVRYGNGIELWATNNQNNNIVRNCIVSRTYDCGMTIQSNEQRIPDVYNIKFVNNRLYRCRQAFEHFITPSDTTCHPEYINCEFSGNICLDMGDNGFNSPEKRDANILSYEIESKNIKIDNNTFYGAPYYCGYVKPIGVRKNKVYIYKGQYLNHYHGRMNYPTILADSEESIKKYKVWSGDDSNFIIIEKSSKRDLKLRCRLERKIGYKKPELQLERVLSE